MKFKLFGRLRDDGSSGSSGDTGQSIGQTSGSSQDMNMGSGLDRTVESMFSQGYSEEEIKRELGSQYSQNEIEDAINTAVASSASGSSMSSGPSPMTPYQSEDQQEAVSPVDKGFENQDSQDSFMDEPDAGQFDTEPSRQTANNSPAPQQTQPSASGNNNSVSPQVEELIETIVAESLDQMENELQNVYGEIDELRQDMENIDQRVHDLEVRDDEDQQEFIQKVNEMEEHVDDYQSRIGGLEKAFQQVLPSLVENVRDLTDLVQEMKQERGIETDKDVSKEEISDIDVEEW